MYRGASAEQAPEVKAVADMIRNLQSYVGSSNNSYALFIENTANSSYHDNHVVVSPYTYNSSKTNPNAQMIQTYQADRQYLQVQM